MRVVSPIKGIIEKIYVSKGQYITPGTPVAKIAGNGDLTIDLALSAQTASRIDTTRYANVIVGSQTYNFPITHVSAVPVQGNLYEVIVNVPNEFNYGMSEGSVVAVALPILGDSDGKSIYIPIDTVYVTNQNSFVLALVEGRAAKVIVETGKVSGSSIEIRSGITTGMVIIENRSVAEGEYVKVN
jgi:multidrug efflux pump subunit AcrA (membrane-fusion protein)